MASQKHKIVALDSWVAPPKFDFDYDISLHNTNKLEEIKKIVHDATIIIVSVVPITRDIIAAAPRLQLVACNGTGTDHIDCQALRERSISLCHVPAQNTESVSQHAFALFTALRRDVLQMHKLVVGGTDWPKDTTIFRRMAHVPLTYGEETLVVVGYGALGKAVEGIGKALGMRVIIAERKGAQEVRPGRTAFDEALAAGTLFIIVAPLDKSTRDMISEPEFARMRAEALVVNVGRGGVVNERDLADALRKGRIAGAGVDVFESEPASPEKCPLIDPTIPNLILSPHIAWTVRFVQPLISGHDFVNADLCATGFASKTIKGTLATVKANIDAFAHGKPQNIVVAGTARF